MTYISPGYTIIYISPGYTIITQPIPPNNPAWQNLSLTTFGSGDDSTSTSFAPISNLTFGKWQFYPVTSPANGTYVLRSQLHIGGFLHSVKDFGDESPCTALGWDCSTSARLGTFIDLNSVWKFTDSLDGTHSFYISNAANGSTYHLDLWPNTSWLRLTNNITGDHPTQEFLVTPVGAIDDVAWQSVGLRVGGGCWKLLTNEWSAFRLIVRSLSSLGPTIQCQTSHFRRRVHLRLPPQTKPYPAHLPPHRLPARPPASVPSPVPLQPIATVSPQAPPQE